MFGRRDFTDKKQASTTNSVNETELVSALILKYVYVYQGGIKTMPSIDTAESAAKHIVATLNGSSGSDIEDRIIRLEKWAKGEAVEW
ncbi:hypothetical protein [Mycobacteroides abscessus]|uniref:hypothetical protein n=1 Tax=Mycobacteroides abscessus TaxID=36809 RepID=UPI0009A702EA|nr:hypothetical protein [Mycobacteroides abscessus]SKT46309.1 Uncharacterised protein [Mycobacteroides abscessus subsp. bolletii]